MEAEVPGILDERRAEAAAEGGTGTGAPAAGQLKAEFRRARGRNLDRQMQELRPLLIGRSNYFDTRRSRQPSNAWTSGSGDGCAACSGGSGRGPERGRRSCSAPAELRTRLDFGLQRSRPVVERRSVAHECGAPETLLCRAWTGESPFTTSSLAGCFREPPYTEPYVRWCGRTVGVTPPPTRCVPSMDSRQEVRRAPSMPSPLLARQGEW